MKFAHMADLHIGGWREPSLSFLTIQAFKTAIAECILRKVDFVIISGDIFNTSLPSIDYIKETTKLLMQLKNSGIPVYIVPGSHDFSPSGKTMLDVLEYAGLLINVAKAKVIDDTKIQLLFTQDKKTGAKITGMLGKKAMLEKTYYDALDRDSLEKEQGFKIFLFHTALDELKPEDLSSMDSSPISMLPKGFDYYAGGHVHIVKESSLAGYKNVIYPGPLFPNSFSELEKLGPGGFYLYDDGKINYIKVITKHSVAYELDCSGKSPEQIDSALLEEFKHRDVKDKIILLRLKGKLGIGRVNEINLKSFIKELYSKAAYFVLKNTSSLVSEEFEEIKKSFEPSAVEDEVIKEHLGQIKVKGMSLEKENGLVKSLITALSREKQEGETNATYEERILKDIGLLE